MPLCSGSHTHQEKRAGNSKRRQHKDIGHGLERCTVSVPGRARELQPCSGVENTPRSGMKLSGCGHSANIDTRDVKHSEEI